MSRKVGRPQGKPKGSTEQANALAEFLLTLTTGMTVRRLAGRYHVSKTLWGEYRSGQKIIPLEPPQPAGAGRHTGRTHLPGSPGDRPAPAHGGPYGTEEHPRRAPSPRRRPYQNRRLAQQTPPDAHRRAARPARRSSPGLALLSRG